jgi:hypothetical protein
MERLTAALGRYANNVGVEENVTMKFHNNKLQGSKNAA